MASLWDRLRGYSGAEEVTPAGGAVLGDYDTYQQVVTHDDSKYINASKIKRSQVRERGLSESSKVMERIVGVHVVGGNVYENPNSVTYEFKSPHGMNATQISRSIGHRCVIVDRYTIEVFQ